MVDLYAFIVFCGCFFSLSSNRFHLLFFCPFIFFLYVMIFQYRNFNFKHEKSPCEINKTTKTEQTNEWTKTTNFFCSINFSHSHSHTKQTLIHVKRKRPKRIENKQNQTKKKTENEKCEDKKINTKTSE